MAAYGNYYAPSSSSSSEDEDDYDYDDVQEEEEEEPIVLPRRPGAIASASASVWPGPIPLARMAPAPGTPMTKTKTKKIEKTETDEPVATACVCVCPHVRHAHYDKGLDKVVLDKLIEPIPAASAAAIAEAVKAAFAGEDAGRTKPVRLMRHVLDAFGRKHADVVYRGSGGLLGAFRVGVTADDATEPLTVTCLGCDATVPCVLKHMERHVRTSDSKRYVDYLAFRIDRDGDTASITEIKDAIDGKTKPKPNKPNKRPRHAAEEAEDDKPTAKKTALTAPATPAPAKRRPTVVPPSPDATAKDAKDTKAVEDAVRHHARALKLIGRADDIPDFLDAVAALTSDVAADFGKFLVHAYEPFAMAAPEFARVFDPSAQTVRFVDDDDTTYHVAVVGRETEPPPSDDKEELGMDFVTAEIVARARKACKDLAIPAVADVATAALRAAAAAGGAPDRAADAFAVAAAGLKTAGRLFVVHRQVTRILDATAHQIREGLRAGKPSDQIELEWDEAAFGQEHMRLVEATEVDKHREACAWLRRRADVARDMIDEVVKTLRFVQTGYINGPTARAIRTALDNADEEVVREMREANVRVAAIERWASGQLTA